MWDWGSPVAWAVFLAGCGVAVLLLAVSLQYISKAVTAFAALPTKRR